MKKIFFIVAFIATAFVQTGFAQHNHSSLSAQATEILPLYYNVKDALIAGNSTLAASKAGDLVKALNGADNKTIEANRKDLIEHAGKIAENKGLKSQRDHFAALSTDMIALAKSTKLSSEPVYQLYCPMKKANWLSSSTTIKNPYYGSSMLTCGKVVETLK